MCRSLAESLWFTANENDPKNQYIHTYIHMQPGMPPWLHFHAHFGAITNPTSWLWTCIALLILFYFFFFTPLHVMQFCIYLSAALAFGCCQNRVTLCARGAAALCMRLFCGYWTPMIYGRGVCVFGGAAAAGGAHGTGCLLLSICPIFPICGGKL